MKILDEAHHLVTDDVKIAEETKSYIHIIKVLSIKQIALTATLKQIENAADNVISNDNVEYFGDIIDRRCLLWAIKENIICDYVIQTIITNDEQIQNISNKFNIYENDKRLFF